MNRHTPTSEEKSEERKRSILERMREIYKRLARLEEMADGSTDRNDQEGDRSSSKTRPS
jgi:hypothetical protein